MMSKSLRNNGKKLGQIRRLLCVFFLCVFFLTILLLNANRVISKERKTVRASKLIRAADNTSKVGYCMVIYSEAS